MRNGWGRVWLRMGAMAAAVLILGLLAKWKSDEARQRNVLAVTLQSSGWANDKFLGKQYQLFYSGMFGKLGPDPQSFRELYAALGSDSLAEPVHGGCMVLFRDKPERVVYAVYINSFRALLMIGGPVQQGEAELMSETILNLAWDAGVKPRRVAKVMKLDDQVQRWEFTFEYN